MKRAIASALSLAAVLLLLSGCANQNLSAYREETPQLDLREYFNGRVMAYGIFQQRDGRVTKRFTVTMDCHLDDAVYEVQFDDWMYLVDDKVMLNRASMSKFGVRLGDITLSFIKP